MLVLSVMKNAGAEYRHAAELRSALRRFLRSSDRVTREHGLTTQRYELLLMVKTSRDGSERTTLGELMERLDAPQSTVTELVHRAEDLGLLTRELDPKNRRPVYLRLTREGEGRLAAAVAKLAGERRRLVSLLREVSRSEDEPTAE
ncbi:MAG: MarR family transcriptional regulator [Actinomycetota bacterium]|nr:MarR family transcriptional regulator [Actinomycetota bacterium]